MTTLTKPRKPRVSAADIRAGDPLRCPYDCPGGNRCVCDRNQPKYVGGAKRPVRHLLHICQDETCVCHSRERYELARRVG